MDVGMKLGALVVADPVEAVARGVADQCARLAERRQVATSGKQALDAIAPLRPEMIIVSLELTRPETLEVVREIRRLLPSAFVIATFRELTVPVMERIAKLGVDDFMPQPIDLTAVFRAAS